MTTFEKIKEFDNKLFELSDEYKFVALKLQRIAFCIKLKMAIIFLMLSQV